MNKNNIFDRDNEIETFELWRNKTITKYENKCMEMDESDIQNSKEAKDDFMKFTRCMIQLTRQMCMCDQDCLAKSYKNVRYHSVCPRLEVNNLFLARNYLDCGSYGIKIVGGDMVDQNAKSIYTDFSIRMRYLITDLCFNEDQSFEAFQCAAYELKDECKDDITCVVKNFPSSNFYGCQNDDFKHQVEEIEGTINFKELSSHFGDHPITTVEEARSGRNIRSANDPLDFHDTNNLQEIESKNLFSVDTTYYVSISALLILGIGYLLAWKYKKRSVNTINKDLENN